MYCRWYGDIDHFDSTRYCPSSTLHDDEVILEIAVVPITAGQPDISAGYSTLINPGRNIPRRHWISPGLTTAVLAAAPHPAEVQPELARWVNGHAVVGHNVAVDWRLLHRR